MRFVDHLLVPAGRFRKALFARWRRFVASLVVLCGGLAGIQVSNAAEKDGLVLIFAMLTILGLIATGIQWIRIILEAEEGH